MNQTIEFMMRIKIKKQQMIRRNILLIALNFMVLSTFVLNAQAVYNGTDRHVFTTPYGTIDVGPRSSTWAHIYTDRSKFIFNKALWVQGGILSTYSTADLWLQTNGTTRMKILNSNGNVGIGSSSPATLLHLKKGSSGGSPHSYADLTLEDNDHGMITILTPNNRTSYFGFADQDDDYVGGMQYRHDTNMMTFRVNNHSSDMVINQDGNVGIGYSDPGTVKLRVNGNIRGQGGISVESGGSYKVSMNGTADGYIVGRDNALQQKFRITSNGDSWLNGGDVGIGTSSPDAKLAVNGDIHAQEVKVDLVGWPDYVFDENYNLPTLEEVQDHIEEKGHLINMPSANEIEANGLVLGEMNKLLLEKIEELTLYTIQQQKEIQEKEDMIYGLVSRLEIIENKLQKQNNE